ncbi:hypothetical protein A3SI_08651 [Nitritalea halalkaliphila LW7]|uniref:Uncharacterized protein n=2 Tax=Nitritalea TaxID=1187887 RepID=I5C4M1_9BACT|nr:hypothetical protein A3SI_08651 [Nitritalea halalkaliphila LW7]
MVMPLFFPAHASSLISERIEVRYLQEEPADLERYEEMVLVADNFLDATDYLVKSFEKQLKRIAKKQGKERILFYIQAEQQGRFPSENEFGRRSQVRLFYVME